MSNELKEIVTKIVSESPEVVCIYSDWKPNGFGGTVFIQIPNADRDHAAHLQVKYTQYIWDTFEYMTDDACSAVIVTDVYEMESVYVLVYDKSKGGIL